MTRRHDECNHNHGLHCIIIVFVDVPWGLCCALLFYFKPRSVQCNATLEFEVSLSANLDGSAKANAFLVQLEHDRF